MDSHDGLFWRVTSGGAPHVGMPLVVLGALAAYLLGVPLATVVVGSAAGFLLVGGLLMTPYCLFVLAAVALVWWNMGGRLPV